MKARYDVLYHRLSITQAAAKYGVNRSTIWRWVQRSPHANQPIFTRSAAPHFHPNQLRKAIVDRILALRQKLQRSAPVIHKHLMLEGITISLSSVERTLRRYHLTRKKKQARWYAPLPRPAILFSGTLVQIDTIHFVRGNKTKFYIYTIIDVCSRLAYAEYHQNLSQDVSLHVILHAQKLFSFPIRMVQADNGPEFRDWLQQALAQNTITLRHSRVHKPNDNAHIERFNRTIQEECFEGFQPNEKTINQKLEQYINYYNNDRLHFGLNLTTPAQFVAKLLT